MKKLVMSKKLVIILSLIFIIVIAIPSSIYGYNNYNFNMLYNKGVEQLSKENFDEAINAFNNSLKYKPNQKQLIESKVNFAKNLKDSKAVFDSAIELENEKKYLEAIDTFKVIKTEDEKRYNDAQNKIAECKKSYIKENLDNAKKEASNQKYNEAIVYLDSILKLDETNKDAKALKDEYNNDIQQIAAEAEKAKKTEVDKLSNEKAKPAAQKTSDSTSQPSDVRSNSNLMINLTGGDPILGRFMGLRIAEVDPQPFGIAFNVIQAGFGYEINYDITFYLVGRTAQYSGKTSGQLVQIPALGNEVPRGENIKIVINFKLNGKTYTTTGYRVLNDRY